MQGELGTYDVHVGPSLAELNRGRRVPYTITKIEPWGDHMRNRNFVLVLCPQQPEQCTQLYKSFFAYPASRPPPPNWYEYNNFLLVSPNADTVTVHCLRYQRRGPYVEHEES